MSRRRPSKKSKGGSDTFIRIGGGWEGSSKGGTPYISLKFALPRDMSDSDKDKFIALLDHEGGISLVGFDNTMKKGEKSPDWNFYVSRDNLDVALYED